MDSNERRLRAIQGDEEKEEERDRHQELLDNIKANLPKLKELRKKVDSDHYAPDAFYRFYHYSYKTYWMQTWTMDIVDALKELAPEGATLNSMFEQILKEGTDKKFENSHNKDWMKHTRPMLEAYFHARFFLEMAIKYGEELDEPVNILPSGWAAFLYLYGMRYG